MEKWPFFHQNHGLTPLQKSQFFDFLNFFFLSLERRFFVLKYRKRHLPYLYCLKKRKLEKRPFFEQNHGLTPLEKSQFFDFFNFFILSLERRFLVLQYRKTHFPGPYCLKKRTGKNGHFLTKTMGYRHK